MSSRLHGLVQTEWRWLIAIYLFLAGAGAGAHLTGVAADFLGWSRLAHIGVCLGWPLVLIGCLCLLGDLGNVKNAWRVARKPDTSWIARGTLIISIFMVVGFLHMILWVWPGTLAGGESAARHVIAVIGAIFAFGTMVYTGLLLGDALPFPFWSTALLPILFFLSALSTGVMAVIFLGVIAAADAAHLQTLARIDVVLIVAEALVLAAYLHSSYRIPNTRMSAEQVLKGDTAPMFWWGVVVCGLVLPVALDLSGRHGAGAMLASVLGLAGGLCLRYVVLAAGAMYPIAAAGFTFRPPTRPKDPLPGIGKLPPSQPAT
ncbi:MAG: NrfD/PsrC family molybdoenzyme membrane anchor subunit [Planctomycetota bacterium]